MLLIAGHIAMAELDVSLSIGLAGSRFVQFAQQFIGAFNATIRETAKIHQCDIVLVDMSPSASALNRCILMSSDYFIIPTSSDFFCYQAIESLAKMLPEWDNDFKDFRKAGMRNALPEKSPKMLGIISQKYRPYKTSNNKDKAKAFQQWIDKIQSASHQVLAKKLKAHEMVIDEDLFRKHALPGEQPYNLISIPDFNTLIAKSQEHNKPVFELTKEELERAGIVLERSQENQDQFRERFKTLAVAIYKIINDDSFTVDKKKFDSIIEGFPK